MSGEYNWDAAWTATGINSSSVPNPSAYNSGVISNDDKLDTEVSVEITYGATAAEGAKVYVLRDVDGTNYEALTDAPWGFEMPYAVGTICRKTFTVPASISAFKISVSNSTGAAVTATVRTRQATVTA